MAATKHEPFSASTIDWMCACPALLSDTKD